MVRSRPQKELAKGFTLIEVLAAVAVLAIALAALVSGMARYADSAGRLRDKTLAIVVAQNRLTEIELEQGWPEEGRRDGETEMAGINWHWEVLVQETPDEHLRRVDVKVRREDADQDDSLAALSAFIADTGRKQ